MSSQYDVIEFDDIPSNGYVEVDTLKKFIEDADILVFDYHSATVKYNVVGVEVSHRGAIIKFVDGTFTYGYRLQSKLVAKK
jgi:hypothetical protein